MRFNPAFNQEEMMKYNQENPTKKIDIVDAIILQQFYWLSVWPDVEKITVYDKEFFWVAYGKLLNEELPALGYKNYKIKNGIKTQTYDVIAKKIKAKLIKYNLLELYVKSEDNSNTFWFLTQRGLKIATPGKPKETTRSNEREPKETTRSNEREPLVKTDVSPSSNGTTNDTSIDYLIKNERERLALSFLKEKEPKRYNAFIETYKPQIREFDKFLLDFQDTVSIENIPFEVERLFPRWKKYARGYIKNQNRFDPIETKENTNGVNSVPSNFMSAADLDKTTKDKEKNALFYMEKIYSSDFKSFNKQVRPHIKDFKKFEIDFNNICFDEDIDFFQDILFNRLKKFSKDWIESEEINS